LRHLDAPAPTRLSPLSLPRRSSDLGHTEFATQHRTIAEELSSLGYTCGYFGKVHYGSEDIGDRACPPHHGFDTTYYGLAGQQQGDRKSTRLNSSHVSISYAVFCLKQ